MDSIRPSPLCNLRQTLWTCDSMGLVEQRVWMELSDSCRLARRDGLLLFTLQRRECLHGSKVPTGCRGKRLESRLHCYDEANGLEKSWYNGLRDLNGACE